MGEFVLKDISMTLDPESVENALREVNSLQWQLRDAMDFLVDYLLNRGVMIAKVLLTSYVKTQSGALRRSIHVEKADGQVGSGYIVAGTPGDIGYDGGDGAYGDISYAVFVEFGFGTGNYYFSNGKRMKNAFAKKNPGAVASSSGRTSKHPSGKYQYRPAKMYGMRTTSGGREFRGWVYKDRKTGKFYTSEGQPPKPFMWDTLMKLSDEAEKDGCRIITEYIA
jgi:hypothetical protein